MVKGKIRKSDICILNQDIVKFTIIATKDDSKNHTRNVNRGIQKYLQKFQ